MACSGSSHDTCSTKSPVPSAAAVLAMFWARCASSSSSRPMARGVKPREMILRSRVCCGASMFSSTALLQVDRVARHLLRPGRDGAVRRAAEDVVALGHLLDVGVLGHEPVAVVAEAAGAAGHVDPVDRLGLAQLGELLDGQTLEVQVRVEEVEVGAGYWGMAWRSTPQLQRVLVPVKHAFSADQRRGRIAACQSNETCSSLTEWVTLSSLKPPAAPSASGTDGCPACMPPSCSAPRRRRSSRRPASTPARSSRSSAAASRSSASSPTTSPG